MKEKYLRLAVINAGAFEIEGIIPWAVTATKAVALVAGYMAGRAATKIMEARPVFKLPTLTEGRRVENDFCLA